MFFFSIQENSNRYKRVDHSTGLFLSINRDFLISNNLIDCNFSDIENFIDEVLEETPIEEISKDFIVNFKYKGYPQ